MNKSKRRTLWFATISGSLLLVLGCYVSPVVRRRQSTGQLVQAVIATDEVKVRAALANGADPNAPLNYTAAFTLRDLPRLLFHKTGSLPDGQTLVTFAAGNCDSGILQALLDAGGDVNAYDSSRQTTLMFAVAMSQHANVKLLVQRGANVNWAGKGQTPLMLAVCHAPDIEDFLFLLAHGADPNLCAQNTNTPLMSAAEIGSTECIQALLQAGAKIDAYNSCGETALVSAAANGKVKAVAQLLKAGADPTHRDQFGETAEEIARNCRQAAAAKIVHDHRRSG